MQSLCKNAIDANVAYSHYATTDRLFVQTLWAASKRALEDSHNGSLRSKSCLSAGGELRGCLQRQATEVLTSTDGCYNLISPSLSVLTADWRGNALYFMNVQREGIKVEGKRKTKKEPESLVSADNSQRLNWAPTDIHPSERGRNRTMKAESGQSVRNLKPHSLHFCLPRSSDQNHFHSPLSVWLIFTPPLQKDEGRTRKNV